MRSDPGRPTTLLRVNSVLATAALFVFASVAVVSAQEDEERTASSEHFTLTWSEGQSGFVDPTDSDGNGTPDSVDATLRAFEDAWAFQIDQLGYRRPPGEGPYRIYAASGANSQVLPVTEPSPSASTNDPDADRSRPSFILFPVGALGDEIARRALASHEFHHAIQAGYDFEEDEWIEEATATWVANLMGAPPADRLPELRDFIPEPRTSLFATDDLHEYGAFLFLQFLVEKYGDTIVRELWESMAVPAGWPGARNLDSRSAIEEVLLARGVQASAAWREFQLWRWRLERFAQGATYKAALEPGTWPRVSATNEVATESCRLDTGNLPPFSGDYVRLKPSSGAGATDTGRLTVSGPPGTAAFFLLKRRGQPPQEHHLIFDESGVASEIVSFDRGIRALTLGLSMGSTTSGGEIGYSLRLDGVRPQVRVSVPQGPESTSFGKRSLLSGTVTCNGKRAGSTLVSITETEIVSGNSVTYLRETDSSGTWQLSIDPVANVTYSVGVIDPLLTTATSEPIAVDVGVFVEMNVSSARADMNDPITVSGIVRPVHVDVPVVVEYRRPEGEWLLGPKTTTRSDGTYSVEARLPRPGVWQIRSRVLDTMDTDHIPTSSEATLVEIEG